MILRNKSIVFNLIEQNENNKTHTTSTATREDLIFIVHAN
jgi:hypothetical protein